MKSSDRAIKDTILRLLQPSRFRILHMYLRGNSRGFTLLETLVVLGIIGLVMSLVGPRVLHAFSDAKVKTARLQIENLGSSVDMFYVDVGRYPTADEGLDALFRQPEGATSWSGPYAKGLAAPKDPWGHAYQYRVPGRQGPYEVVSLGPEGRDGSGVLTGVGSATSVK